MDSMTGRQIPNATSTGVIVNSTQLAWQTPRQERQSSGRPAAPTLNNAGLGVLRSPRYDPVPNVRVAGKVVAPDGGLPIAESPKTPDNLGEPRRRHRMRTDPGAMSTNWAMKDYVVPLPDNGYGQKSGGQGESVAITFQSGLKMGVAEYKEGVAEAKYARTTREPLGRGYIRGHVLPEDTSGSDFMFGKAVIRSSPAKESISPQLCPDSPEAKELYKRTHLSYDPGEPMLRHYKWPSEVASRPGFTFGKSPQKDSSNEGHGVRALLNTEDVQSTGLLPVKGAEYFEVNQNHRGRAKLLGQVAERNLPDGHTYGLPSKPDGPPGFQILPRNYTPEEQMPDADLGKSIVKPSPRNLPDDHIFGKTSKPEPKTAASLQNSNQEARSIQKAFWDDSDTGTLLSPGRFDTRGIKLQDFTALRSASELVTIFQGIRQAAPSQEVIEAASLACGGTRNHFGEPMASVEATMHFYTDANLLRPR